MEIKNSFRLISSLGKDRIILLCSFFYMVILLPVMAGCANSKACVSEEIPFWLTPDSTICSHLDGDLKKVLFMPDSVKCYVLVQKDSISEKGLSPVENYVRDSLMAEFGVRETTVLQYELQNPFSSSGQVIAHSTRPSSLANSESPENIVLLIVVRLPI